MAKLVKKEGWKAKITPLAIRQPTASVPSLFAFPVVLEISVPPDVSRASRESDQARLFRLLRELDELPEKHQLVGVEIVSTLQAGFSAKVTYHYYRIRRG